MSINININYSFKYESEVLSNMRKRLLTLMLVGVLGFVPTVTMFSPPNIVYAADESELKELSKYIKFGNASEDSFFINEIKKDLVVVAYDGESYYQLSANAYKVDDETISPYFEFTDDKRLSNKDLNSLSKSIKKGNIQKLEKSVFDENIFAVKEIPSKISNPINSYLFFTSGGVYLAELSTEEIEELAKSTYEEPTAELTAIPTDITVGGVYVELEYKLGLKDDIVNSVSIYNKDGEFLDRQNLDSDKSSDVIEIVFMTEESGDFDFVIESGKGATATSRAHIDLEKIEKDSQILKDESLGKIEYDETEPIVKFENTNTPTLEGSVLTITMKTQVPTMMTFDNNTPDEYAKSQTFDVYSNGKYRYFAITKSGKKVSGYLDISCFKSESEYKLNSKNNSSVNNSEDSNKDLPKTGAVATGLIISCLGLFTGIFLLRNSFRKRGINDEDKE